MRPPSSAACRAAAAAAILLSVACTPGPRPGPAAPELGSTVELHVEGAAARGPADAPVTIVEFADFRCRYCRHTQHVLERVLRAYSDDVRLVFVHFPVVSEASSRAAVAAVAAQRQNRFWEMHDFLFRQQGIPLREDAVLDHARSLGLDEERYANDLRDAEVIAVVQANMDEARRVGLRGTPAFFVNGRRLQGSRSFEAFRAAIDAELSRTPSRTTSAPERELPHGRRSEDERPGERRAVEPVLRV